MATEDQEGYASLLRTATRDPHRRLDRHPLLAPLTSSSVTRPDYARALAALHGPHGAIELALHGFAPANLFPARVLALAEDLSDLDATPQPLRAEPPALRTPAMLIGAMYVIEGSNLGGTVIARELARHLPAGTPMRFFGGASGAVRWRRFWQFVSGRTSPAALDETVDAARATFRFYGDHLDACLP